MNKSVEPYTNKQEFDNSVINLFNSYLKNREKSFEEQINKTEE